MYFCFQLPGDFCAALDQTLQTHTHIHMHQSVYMGWYVTARSVADRGIRRTKTDKEKLQWMDFHRSCSAPSCMHFWRYRQPAASVWFHMCCLFFFFFFDWDNLALKLFLLWTTVNATPESWLHTFRLFRHLDYGKCIISIICVNVSCFFRCQWCVVLCYITFTAFLVMGYDFCQKSRSYNCTKQMLSLLYARWLISHRFSSSLLWVDSGSII